MAITMTDAAAARVSSFLTNRGKGIGLRLAFGIEYANVAQVRIAGGKLQGHRHLQPIPGAFPSQCQGSLGAEVGRSVLGDRQWQ